MGLGRYVSRRYVGLLQYLMVLGGMYLIYCLVSNDRPSIQEDELDIRFPGHGGRPPAAPRRPERLKHLDDPAEKHEEQRRLPDAHLKTIDDLGLDPMISYKNLPKINWEDMARYREEQSRNGPGEQGKPYIIPTKNEQIEKEVLALYQANGYSAYVSDQIALNRSVKDIRNQQCRKQKYSSKLPTVSVIFPFHEEHNSTLLRSAYSIINRSPKDVLHEIILVDDFSEKPFLKQPLDDYWKTAGLDHIVKVVRTKRREGLIRARQIGAEQATGEVLVFLDAHSEANYNWLPPLLDPITEDYRTVVCPFVDIIDCDTYEIRPQDEGARGSFDWAFNYKRLPLRKIDRENPTKPFPSPVMAGGYFAISSKWFWELGGYDEGLDIWGGEQYELSFKLWQCHGRMFDAPCSRVAHIYRCKYQPFKSAGGVGDFISRNYRRVAEVWMDDYKHHLFKNRPGVGTVDTGDISRMKAIREKLQCKSFDWFMKEVAFDQDKYYPAVEPLASAHGELRNEGSRLCVDTHYKSVSQRIGLRKCLSDDPNAGGEQNIRLTRWHDLRPDGRAMCFDCSSSVEKSPVVLFDCHSMKGNQLFKYRVEKRQIHHPISGKCLASELDGNENFLYIATCKDNAKEQQWTWEHLDKELLAKRQAAEPFEFD